MFKLTKTENTARDELVASLEIAGVDLSRVIEEVNLEIEQLFERANVAVEKYNDTLAEARSFVEDIATRFRDEYDEKSECWQKGERGEQANGLANQWECIDLEPVKPLYLEFLEMSDLAHHDDLENLPGEAE